MLNNDKELYDLCLRREWHKVVRVSQNQPALARYVGDEGTPLHVACMGRPSVRVVQQLVSAFPTATDIVSAGSLLPVHLACLYNASVSVLKTLVQASPQSSICKTATNATALNVLCEAEENTETSHVCTNSSVLWHKRRDDLQQVNYKSLFWQKIQVLLEAVANHRQQQTKNANDSTLYILHAAVSLEECCPLEVLHYALHRYPEQICLRDHTGRLPLHIALAWSVRQKNQQQQASLRKFQPKERQVSCQLLEHYPKAAGMRDHSHVDGRYPLHTALAHGHEWYAGGVIREIYQCAPHVLAEPDPPTQLYPFQMSDDLDSTYQLLRRMPSVLHEYLVQNVERMASNKSDPVSEIVQAMEEDENDEALFESATCFDVGRDSFHSTLFFDVCLGDDPIVIKEVEPHPRTSKHFDHILPVLTDAEDKKLVQGCINYPEYRDYDQDRGWSASRSDSEYGPARDCTAGSGSRLWGRFGLNSAYSDQLSIIFEADEAEPKEEASRATYDCLLSQEAENIKSEVQNQVEKGDLDGWGSEMATTEHKAKKRNSKALKTDSRLFEDQVALCNNEDDIRSRHNKFLDRLEAKQRCETGGNTALANLEEKAQTIASSEASNDVDVNTKQSLTEHISADCAPSSLVVICGAT